MMDFVWSIDMLWSMAADVHIVGVPHLTITMRQGCKAARLQG